MSTKRDRQRARRTGAAQRRVAGEAYEVLVGDLLSFEWEHEDDGMVHLHAEGLSPAFMRAHMRIEADSSSPTRTPGPPRASRSERQSSEPRMRSSS